MVLAEGYSYPVVVERAPVIDEAALQLGDTSTDVETMDLPARGVPTPAVVSKKSVPQSSANKQLAGVPAAQLEVARPPAPVQSEGGTASAGFADSGRAVSLYASDKTFRLEYEQDSTAFGLEDARVSAGFLLGELRDTIFTGTMMLDTFPGLIPNVRFSIGTRLYLALLGAENQDVLGLGVGVQGAYELPLEAFPLSVGASFHYTPDILVFGQSDRIWDLSVDAGLPLRDNLSAFIGLRVLQFDTRPGTRTVEDDIHLGITWHLGAPGDNGSQGAEQASSTSFQ